MLITTKIGHPVADTCHMCLHAQLAIEVDSEVED